MLEVPSAFVRELRADACDFVLRCSVDPGDFSNVDCSWEVLSVADVDAVAGRRRFSVREQLGHEYSVAFALDSNS